MRTDGEIRDDVIGELEWDPQITNSDAIGVAVKDGAVTLAGNVPTHADKLPLPPISVFPERTAVTLWAVEIQLP